MAYVATVDEHLQVAGAESFNKFAKYVMSYPVKFLSNPTSFYAGESATSTEK